MRKEAKTFLLLKFPSMFATRCADLCVAVAACILLLAITPHARAASDAVPGIAWNVRGEWVASGAHGAIHTGDAIFPGSLLQPKSSTSMHSITLLLPDGQRILYECFAEKDCAHGFRVPTLYRKPEIAGVDFVDRVRAVITRAAKNTALNIIAPDGEPQDEAVAVIGPDNHVMVGGLAATLSPARYVYSERSIGFTASSTRNLLLTKTSRNVSLAVPGPGLFNVIIRDASGRLRVNLIVAAIRPSQRQTIIPSFNRVHALVENWNDDYMGWPVHTFQRAYLASLVLGIGPQPVPRAPLREPVRADETNEPAFSPVPGAFRGDVLVKLQCSTPGAVIHYTIDTSQPFDSSPVYKAPIVVMGTELTIKAFASAPGKKDSPVVTGIFRIEDD